MGGTLPPTPNSQWRAPPGLHLVESDDDGVGGTTTLGSTTAFGGARMSQEQDNDAFLDAQMDKLVFCMCLWSFLVLVDYSSVAVLPLASACDHES